jgi:hypothetical protein
MKENKMIKYLFEILPVREVGQVIRVILEEKKKIEDEIKEMKG